MASRCGVAVVAIQTRKERRMIDIPILVFVLWVLLSFVSAVGLIVADGAKERWMKEREEYRAEIARLNEKLT